MNSTSSFVTVPAASSYTLTITITITTLQCMREYQVLVEMHALFDTRHIEQRRTYTARITLVHVKALVLDILQYFCSFVLHGENRVTHNTQGEGECKQTPRQVSTKCSPSHAPFSYVLPSALASENMVSGGVVSHHLIILSQVSYRTYTYTFGTTLYLRLKTRLDFGYKTALLLKTRLAGHG